MTVMVMSLDAPMRDDQMPAPSRLSRFMLGSGALLGAVAAVWSFFQFTGLAPVARLQVQARFEWIDPAELDRALRPLLQSRFFEVDLKAVQRAAAALPWVARARVEREWPATVRVRVWEREPAAHWHGGLLLDVDGTRFDPAGREVAATLPRLAGPEGSERRVLTMFTQLAAKLEGTRFALAGLRLDARGDWTATTVDGIELRFGRNDPLQGVDMLLGPAARALAAQMPDVEHIDLRYTNGFSVGWREPAAGNQGN
ncbi:cell division protein FtsQ/DivIB [Sinimarinibacterium thermocellulolyticum]|uniref:Cell division protein FtsQ n=1 Tax=Sinimarinibacterium thermocellulolyticum TaxID=3170016 RepID=A0ABV2A9M0_9GAMM